MNRSGWNLVLLVAIMSGPDTNAQVKTDTLKGVEVRSGSPSATNPKAAFQPGAKVTVIDSFTRQLYNQQSIATLLSQVSSVFVKSYGFNSLATLSFRGASSAQSAVFWEGIPLMNGATGITDVSLLPVAFSDSVSIEYGSGGALGGSGNVGGALVLGSKQASFPDHAHWGGGAQIGYGSFGNVPASAELGFSSRRASVRIRGVTLRAENDFLAADESGHEFRTQHSTISGEGLMLDASVKANHRNTISLHAWQQAYQRQIPRALFESRSLKVQDDAALRLLMEWKYSAPKIQAYAKGAYMEDGYGYSDPDISIETNVTTHHFYGEIGISGKFNPTTSWLAFAPVQLMYMSGANDTARLFRTAGAVSLKKNFLSDRLSIALNGRGELIGQQSILLPGVSGFLKLSPAFGIRASVQRSYRAPTLNELYYFPGGNKDLKPENGWNDELGYTWTKNDNSGISMTHSLSAYNRNINDWIIWLGGAIWTPHNLAAVHSRGLETENSLAGRIGSIRWTSRLTAAYTRSSPTASYLVNDNSIGKQIPYTPILNASAAATIAWKSVAITYVHRYTGKRYITSDESAYVPWYTKGDLLLNVSMHGTRINYSINGSVQNLWNTDYQVVAFRPMPGIYYLFSVAITTR